MFRCHNCTSGLHLWCCAYQKSSEGQIANNKVRSQVVSMEYVVQPEAITEVHIHVVKRQFHEVKNNAKGVELDILDTSQHQCVVRQ